MKVLNLSCSNGHDFEGWFASHDDFSSQDERKLIACPLCGDSSIQRRPSAPHLNVVAPRGDALPVSRSKLPSAAQPAAPASSSGAAAGSSGGAVVPAQLQAVWMQAVRELMDRTEDVGDRFPEEARRIHYGEAAERGIRGRATPDDAEALRDEGIEILALPVPAALKGSLQ